MPSEQIEQWGEYLERDAEYRAMGGRGHLIGGGAPDDDDKGDDDGGGDADDKTDPQASDDDTDDDLEGEDFDVERAKATIRAQRKAEKAARADARKAARERDELAAKLRDREDAELSELERAQARAKELEEQAEKATQAQRATALRYEVAIHAGKANLHEPEVAYRLLDLDAIEYDDDGSPTNVEALIKQLVKDHPYLVKGKASADVDPNPDSRKGPKSDDEVRKQAGNRLYRARL